ncbi:MAG TPA: hypothetical protein VK253_02710 [Candidatus Binatia bacterium]|nr:hypothetical protein [Candidatus Binatia bacterium]
MLTSATKRFMLPFLAQKTSAADVEAAAVFAVAEFERNKGRGLIARQPEEKLVCLSKAGYPLWLLPKNDSAFVFDGFNDFNFSVSYADVPSAKAFLETLEANSRTRENYTTFLSDHCSYFQQSPKEKQFMFRGLISNLDFKSEFSVYCKEAAELVAQTNLALLSPTLQETAVSLMIAEFDKVQSSLREEAERLQECTRLVNKTTSQYITEIDYEASAVKDEADAKIRAQEELVNPKIAKLTKEYQQKIKNLTESFDQENCEWQKLKTKKQKSIQTNEEKIELYQNEARAQAAKNHAIYEKRWKEKIKQHQKELNSLKKELKNIEGNVKKTSKQKQEEISKLNFGLDGEIKFARQPLLELEAARNARMLFFKQETDRLLKLEKPIIEGLSKSIKLRETIKANFEVVGIKDQGLKSTALFYIPFFVAYYEMGSARRYLTIPPSTIGAVDFSAKLKSVLGMSKTRDLLVPRFKSITTLIEEVQMLAKQNGVFESQLNGLAQKNNLLNNSLFKENVEKGLVYLKHEGWLSDKEQQTLSNRLSA